MDWNAQVDGYCERIGTEFWAEPVNALTNLAFLVVAVVMWHRAGGVPHGRLLATILFLIGVGSFLFHTLATRWAGLADVLPIAAFVLVYIHAANRAFLGWSRLWSLIGVLAFVPWTMALVPLFSAIPGFAVSAVYWPVPALILLYAAVLAGRLPDVARGLAQGAALLLLSLTLRSIDAQVCGALPVGTHFLWHVLNALMLGWMIAVLVRHNLAARGAGR